MPAAAVRKPLSVCLQKNIARLRGGGKMPMPWRGGSRASPANLRGRWARPRRHNIAPGHDLTALAHHPAPPPGDLADRLTTAVGQIRDRHTLITRTFSPL